MREEQRGSPRVVVRVLPPDIHLGPLYRRAYPFGVIPRGRGFRGFDGGPMCPKRLQPSRSGLVLLADDLLHPLTADPCSAADVFEGLPRLTGEHDRTSELIPRLVEVAGSTLNASQVSLGHVHSFALLLAETFDKNLAELLASTLDTSCDVGETAHDQANGPSGAVTPPAQDNEGGPSLSGITVHRSRAGEEGATRRPAALLTRRLRHDPLGRLYAVLTLAAWFIAGLVWAHGWTP